MLKYVVCLCKGSMCPGLGVVLSVFMVTRGAVGVRVWEV